jgi:hypothetical protein
LKSAKSLSLHRVARKAKTALTSSFCQVQEFGSYKEIIQTPARTEILCTRESGVEHLLDGRIDRPISTGQYRQANSGETQLHACCFAPAYLGSPYAAAQT